MMTFPSEPPPTDALSTLETILWLALLIILTIAIFWQEVL